MIKVKSVILDRISTRWLVLFWIISQAAIVFLYSTIGLSQPFIIKLCFMYCSPGLILSGVVVFIIFSRFNFKSKLINKIASTTYDMYIIHHQPFVLQNLIGLIVGVIYVWHAGNKLLFVSALLVNTIFIMVCCTILSLMMKPMFNIITNFICGKLPHIEEWFKEYAATLD